MSKSFNNWQLCFAVLASAVVMVMPDLLNAATVTAFEKSLCTMAQWFSSGTGKALATIGVTIIGIGALLGKVSWGMALIVAIGVGIVFGAPSLINAVASGPDAGCTDADGGVNKLLN